MKCEYSQNTKGNSRAKNENENDITLQKYAV